jgi:hypothetical protein
MEDSFPEHTLPAARAKAVDMSGERTGYLQTYQLTGRDAAPSGFVGENQKRNGPEACPHVG